MPRKRINGRHALLIGVAGLALLSGCTAYSSGTLADAEKVSDRVENRYEAIDGYTATVTRTVATSARTSTTRARITANTSTQARIEYLAGSRAGTTRTVDLSAETPALTFSSGLQSATDEPIPSYGALAETLVRTNNVTVQGTEYIDGERTIVVSLTPTETGEQSVDVERQVWIETDRRVPLRVRTTWTTSNGRTVTETVQYSDVSLREHGSSVGVSEADSTGQRVSAS